MTVLSDRREGRVTDINPMAGTIARSAGKGGPQAFSGSGQERAIIQPLAIHRVGQPARIRRKAEILTVEREGKHFQFSVFGSRSGASLIGVVLLLRDVAGWPNGPVKGDL
jgi:hypothetical protein